MEFWFRLVGISPLLTHSPGAMGDGGAVTRGSNVPSPEEEAERGCYFLPDGSCGLPAVAVRNAIVRAAASYKVRGRSMRTVVSHIIPTADLIPLLDPDTGDALRKYEIDVRRAVVQRSAVLRARPRFDRWAVESSLEFDAELVAGSVLAEIAQDAGRRIGVGDYRPERGGWFGRFFVAAWEERPME